MKLLPNLKSDQHREPSLPFQFYFWPTNQASLQTDHPIRQYVVMFAMTPSIDLRQSHLLPKGDGPLLECALARSLHLTIGQFLSAAFRLRLSQSEPFQCHRAVFELCLFLIVELPLEHLSLIPHVATYANDLPS